MEDKNKDNFILIHIPAPKPGNIERLDLSFLQEIPPRTQGEKDLRQKSPLTQEEIDAYLKALCPPSLRSSEDEM